MKSFIKEHLKRFPALYSFLRYKKMEVRHKLLNQPWRRNYFKTIKNLLNNLDLEPKYAKEEFPQGSLIEITNACNLDCVMCNSRMAKRPIGFMEPQTFEIILQQLKTIGIGNVGLHTVGEPFMYKNLKELFEIAERYWVLCVVEHEWAVSRTHRTTIHEFSEFSEFLSLLDRWCN